MQSIRCPAFFSLLMAFAIPSVCIAAPLSFRTHIVTTNAPLVRGVSLADVDGDGDLDLMSADSGLARDGGNAVVWYENDGGSQPQFTKRVIATNRLDSTFLLGADMNGDGIMDIISSSITDDKIAYYENDGSSFPSFTERVITVDPVLGDPEGLINGFADGVRMISVGDLDGDGDLDVASSSPNDNRIAWFENQGTNWVPHSLTDTLGRARAVWVADLDGDSDLDVIGGAWEDEEGLVWFENDGNPSPTFTEHVLMTFEVNPHWPDAVGGLWRMVTEDIDGDGDIDVLAARRADGSLEWYESDGGTPPQFTRHTIVPGVWGGKSVSIADLDNDGDMDPIFASRNDDRIAWYENDGTSSPQFVEHLLQIDPDGIGANGGPLQGLAAGARSVFAGDIDGDGDQDILWGALDGGIVAWEENLLIDSGGNSVPEPASVQLLCLAMATLLATRSRRNRSRRFFHYESSE